MPRSRGSECIVAATQRNAIMPTTIQVSELSLYPSSSEGRRDSGFGSRTPAPSSELPSHPIPSSSRTTRTTRLILSLQREERRRGLPGSTPYTPFHLAFCCLPPPDPRSNRRADRVFISNFVFLLSLSWLPDTPLPTTNDKTPCWTRFSATPCVDRPSSARCLAGDRGAGPFPSGLASRGRRHGC